MTCEVMGETVRYFHAKKAGVDRVFVDHPLFLSKVWGKTESKLYGAKSGARLGCCGGSARRQPRCGACEARVQGCLLYTSPSPRDS